MRIKKRYRVLLCVLGCCILLSLLGFCYSHGEWWFPLTHQLRRAKPLGLTVISLSGESKLYTVDELAALEGVSVTNTLMLVNSAHPLPAGYLPQLVEYNGAQMHPLMKDSYIALRDDVQEKTGVRIYVASDYRTAEEQAEILASSGSDVAAEIGCSEHEAGLALDVYAPYCAGMSFLRSRAGRTVNRICADYGYIIRYPYGKEAVTGIDYEPWHLRYVGAPHAKLMTESKLTLEEYIASLTPNVWYQNGEYLIARLSTENACFRLPADFSQCEISPDNTGYYIVTVRK